MKRISATERLTLSFRKSEMRCRCRSETCDAVAMDMGFMTKLQALRDEWGQPLIVTSAARCKSWNQKTGGAEKSQHMLGKAADILMPDASAIPRFVLIAEKIGFGGIGIGLTFVHLDSRDGHARWTY